MFCSLIVCQQFDFSPVSRFHFFCVVIFVFVYFFFFCFFSFILYLVFFFFFFFFSSRRRHTRWNCDWSSDVLFRSNVDYLLASACDEIVMPEPGVLMMVGLRAEVTFYKNLFQMIGVKAEMLRVGEFKSAAEPYRSEERRVGKECGKHWSSHKSKKIV